MVFELLWCTGSIPVVSRMITDFCFLFWNRTLPLKERKGGVGEKLNNLHEGRKGPISEHVIFVFAGTSVPNGAPNRY